MPDVNINQRPKHAGKTSAEKLQSVPRWRWMHSGTLPETATLLDFHFGNHRFDFLWNPKHGAERLFVLFSGDALRAKNNPPVFQRWSWSRFFPGHCLFVSDPALYASDKISLAWYSGARDCDYLKVIACIVDEVCARLAVSADSVYAYGSSGGGFAAIRLLHFLHKANAIAINPQTRVCEYEYRSVERYLSALLGASGRNEGEEKFAERLNLCKYAKFLKGRKIFYVQNEADVHHVNMHYQPFCEALGFQAEHDLNHKHFKRYHFSHPDGHKRAEPPEVFLEIVSRIESGNF